MAKKPERIIIDTNLWIAFLIKGDFRQLDEKIRSGKIRVLFSLESMDEILSVAARPKFKKYFDRKDIEDLIDLFDAYGEIIDVLSKVEICRDPKDNFLLSLAKDSKANYLITGDDDLLAIKKLGRTKIVTISDYIIKGV